MTKIVKNKSFRVISAFIMVLLIGMMCTFTAFASNTNSQDALAKRQLTTYVQSQLSSNEYEATGGGSIKGSDLLTKDSSSGSYDLDEGEFNKLTSSAQTELVQDIADKSYEAEENASKTKNGGTSKVTEETVQNWWKQLQTKKGAGSKFMNVILENTKPDFVKANQIYEPFSGIIGTVMGLIAVVGMGLLGIVLVADIFYIVIPPVRMLVAEEGGGEPGGGRSSRKSASKLFSDDALYAVKVAEESNDSGGSKKQALGVYLKRRIPMLILLGICLLYLVQGQIYTLVSYILDLVSGFLGF